MILRLFNNLAKLEYIGKRKDTGIFVKEQVIQKEISMFIKEPSPDATSATPYKKRNSFFLE